MASRFPVAEVAARVAVIQFVTRNSRLNTPSTGIPGKNRGSEEPVQEPAQCPDCFYPYVIAHAHHEAGMSVLFS